MRKNVIEDLDHFRKQVYRTFLWDASVAGAETRVRTWSGWFDGGEDIYK